MSVVEKIDFKTFTDSRGDLTVIELKDYIDWEPKRIYYVTDTKEPRGGHAVLHEKKFYVCMKGTLKARLHDGKEWHEFELKGPNEAIMMKEMCFRDFYDFSEDAVMMAVSSVNYVPEDYIYDFDQFLEAKNQQL